MKKKNTELSFEYNGKWFLPGNPEDKIVGKLTFDSEKSATLHLIGKFNDRVQELGSEIIILGETTNGLFITLYKCNCVFFNDGLNDTYETSWSIRYILTGAQFETPEDMLFNRVSIGYVNLNLWLGVTGFNNLKVDREKCEFEVKFKLPEKITYNYHDHFLFGFDFVMSYPRFDTDFLDFSQSTRMYLFNDTNPIHFDQIMDHAVCFWEFLTFATFQPTKFQSFILESKEIASTAFGRHTPLPIKVFFVNSTPLLSANNPFRFLFGYEDIHEKTILSWFENRSTLRPVIELFLDYLCNPNKFTTQTFLNLTQAIETFHRRKRPGTDIPEQDHKKRCEEIISSIPVQHEKFIKELLSYSNEQRLRRRLKDLMIEFDCPTLKKVIPNFKRFCDKIVENRNYYTHYGQDKEKIAANRAELFRLTEKLKILLVFCLLSELGFSIQQSEHFLGMHLYRYCRAIGE